MHGTKRERERVLETCNSVYETEEHAIAVFFRGRMCETTRRNARAVVKFIHRACKRTIYDQPRSPRKFRRDNAAIAIRRDHSTIVGTTRDISRVFSSLLTLFFHSWLSFGFLSLLFFFSFFSFEIIKVKKLGYVIS